jgi:hypothetical protein
MHAAANAHRLADFFSEHGPWPSFLKTPAPFSFIINYGTRRTGFLAWRKKDGSRLCVVHALGLSNVPTIMYIDTRPVLMRIVDQLARSLGRCDVCVPYQLQLQLQQWSGPSSIFPARRRSTNGRRHEGPGSTRTDATAQT